MILKLKDQSRLDILDFSGETPRKEPAKLLIRWLCSYHFNNATFKDND